MPGVIFGNHSAIRVRREERDRIRRFFGDVLGGTVTRSFDDKDDICLGSDFHIAFLYARGDGARADKGVNCASEDALSADEFLRATFLELKAEEVNVMRNRIVAFGVRVLDVPDPHLYFQAPGGQVFRLVGIDEDLSRYEGAA